MRPLLSLAMLALALGGCGGGDEAETKSEDQAVVATQSDAEIPAWLSPTDPMDTGRWLASREAGRPVPNDDAASAQMRRSLGRAQSFFIEDPRMIANRTVQLGQMLGEAGQKEGYQALIEGLTRVAQGAKGRQLYGEMCQHYYNNRHRGDDRATALAQLTERYGSQREGEAKP
ncbi:hypothetical protein [Methylobacterium haplocladii]|uniref:MxaH protein n=1 Tax=Methylobacterium haplocladii TaxID=1176176 RepID=A0A512IU37_9HYPH|nr:hypothetical protein [Methylobacterium haplocladii]GEP01222.1 hypothetical protein MHA02_36090 [Methylobacterium haplocladii]GJD86306.1 hypothetical protein HPGCJGGD_4211 [Methylobacterium haplocladii]GLS60815.1 hypothetical protein GCM10007887_35030 [Methylobacterium haplocladii]